LPRAFDIPGVDRFDLDGLFAAWWRDLGINMDDFKNFEATSVDQTFMLLVVLYVAEMDPKFPARYIDTLARKQVLGTFCIFTTLRLKCAPFRYGLKEIKDISEGMDSNA
jgi:hypothetical protein